MGSSGAPRSTPVGLITSTRTRTRGQQGQPPQFTLHYGDLTDSTNLIRIIQQVQPDEIYNLGAQSHVAVSFESGVHRQLRCVGHASDPEAVRILGLNSKTRIYQASTSELYGLVQEIPQESTPFYPRSPYGVAKLCYWITVNYRESYGMYACNGVLFNHESPRRGETFVTRKMRGLARINEGLDDCLYMGNLDSLRDWGHARDYVQMQWLMLQQEQPEDFVIATGRRESVRRFIELTVQQLGWGAMQWDGKGTAEVGRRGDTGAVVMRMIRAISARLRWILWVIPAKRAKSWAGRRRQRWRNWLLRWWRPI